VDVVNRLKALRERHCWTQAEVARRLGLEQQTVSGHELGKHRIDDGTLVKYAELYGCSVDYILGRAEQGNARPRSDPSSEGGDIVPPPKGGDHLSVGELVAMLRDLHADLRAAIGVADKAADAAKEAAQGSKAGAESARIMAGDVHRLIEHVLGVREVESPRAAVQPGARDGEGLGGAEESLATAERGR
jgi:transcriptional regulator with XRE-family HTH domain